MKHPAVIVLNALLNGLEIKDQGFTYCMSEDNELCWIAKSDKDEQLLFKANWDLNGFIKFCENIPDEEIAALVGSLVVKNTYSRPKELQNES